MTLEKNERQSLLAFLRDLRNAAAELPDVAEDAKELLAGDVQLGIAEMRESAKRAGIASAIGAAAGLFAVIGLVFACLTLMFVLATAMDLWLAALVTTLIIFAVAAIAGLVARARLKQVTPMPKRAVESLRKDVTWLREQINSSRS